MDVELKMNIDEFYTLQRLIKLILEIDGEERGRGWRGDDQQGAGVVGESDKSQEKKGEWEGE